MSEAHSKLPTTLDGRTAAVLAMTDALAGQHFVGEALREMRSAGRLSGREAALAMEIGQGAMRHIITVDHVLSATARFDRRRTVPRLRAILYAAAYQIIWMDRIPPFAAADQAVGLARRLVGGRSPSMVNAVLRRLTGAIDERFGSWQRLDAAQVRVDWKRACRFCRPVLPGPEEHGAAMAYLAAATGERPERYAALCQRYSPEQAEAVAWASQALPATVVQRNPLRATPDAFEQYLRTACGDAAQIVGDAAFVPPWVSVIDTSAFQEGVAYVQDTAAHRAALAVGAQPGERVLDLCAAPGGKSIALALTMEDRGTIVACDADANRLGRVDANITRLRLTSVRTRLTRLEGDDTTVSLQPFDAALVDVPCSNTGVIARRPEARLGLTERKLRSLVGVQQRLLETAARSVRPGGRVVYSTCSLEPEENEQVVAAFVAAHPGWQLDEEQTTLPAWGPRWSDWRDGGYFARLVGRGVAEG